MGGVLYLVFSTFVMVMGAWALWWSAFRHGRRVGRREMRAYMEATKQAADTILAHLENQFDLDEWEREI